MKKILLPFILAATLTTALSAQCPPQIEDPNGNGDPYNITLTNISQCPAHATTITINSAIYSVNNCGDLAEDGIIILQLIPDGNPPVVLSTDAPVTISGGGFTNCMYNSSGILTTLPVELIAFKGTPSVLGNLLTWQTASEVNNKGFEVERLNGNDWQNISFVTGNNKASTYEFTDKAPLSISYYRLKQVDFDGKFDYSKVVSVVQSGKGKSFKIYPNPVSNVLTLETESAGDYQIINLLGQQVLTGKKASLGVESIDVSALPQGSYWLKTGSDIAKFIKQ